MATPIDLADRVTPQFRAAFLAMVESLALVDQRQLEYLLARGDIAGVVRLWTRHFGSALQVQAILSDLFANLVTSSIAAAASSAGFVLREGAGSARAQTWISNRAGRLIIGVSQDSVSSIRQLLGGGFLDGIGARAQGRLLRSSVGLLPSHATAVGRYVAQLQRRRTPENQIAHFGQQYAQRLLNYRAENIARTEMMTASWFAQVEGWAQMLDEGLLDRRRTWMEWMTTEDDRLCPLCAPMDGKRVRVGEYFQATHKGFPEGKPDVETPGSRRMRRSPIRPDPLSQPRDSYGRFMPFFKRDTHYSLDRVLRPLPTALRVLHPPLHPSCRCAVKLVFEGTVTG